MAVRGYRELVVWRRAMQLARETYRVAAALPPSERYGMASQLRRAAVSVASNIAEGHSRAHVREFLQLLSVARGSTVELETQLLLAQLVGHVRGREIRTALALCDEVSRMLTVMRAKLADRLPADARRSALGAQHTARKNSSQSLTPYTILSHRASGSASGLASASTHRDTSSARSVTRRGSARIAAV